MRILHEGMLHQRSYLSSNLASAVDSLNTSCTLYWIYGKVPKVIIPDNRATMQIRNAERTTFAGTICVKDSNECKSSPCLNGGTRVDDFHDFKCDCLSGYTGRQCEQEVDECASNPCSHDADCIDRVNDYFCICSQGYIGKNCRISVTSVVLGTLLSLAVLALAIVACVWCSIPKGRLEVAAKQAPNRAEGIPQLDNDQIYENPDDLKQGGEIYENTAENEYLNQEASRAAGGRAFGNSQDENNY